MSFGKLPARAAALRQAGFTLVELMVAMVIGLVVIGAVLATYLGSVGSGRGTTALGQITEDADIALRLLRTHLSMADFSRPYAATAGGGFTRILQGKVVGIFGCDGGFVSHTKENAPGDADASDPLTCVGDTDPKKEVVPDAVAVRYEADASNSYAPAATGIPTDCLGGKLPEPDPAPPVGVPAYYMADNRFIVSANSLSCAGNGNTFTSSPLVENVVNLQLRYGVAAAGTPGQVQQYLTATAVNTANAWPQVVSVRACIVVSSEGPVMDEITPYYGCAEVMETPTDKKMYRAFTTTVMLQNRTL